MMLSVRHATETDIAAIRELAKVVYPTLYEAAQAKRLLKRLYSEDALERALANPATSYLMAHEADDLRGLCVYGSALDEECADLKEIFRLLVHPDGDHESIGAALLDALDLELDDESCDARISVYVDPAQRNWLDFYIGWGFHHEMVEDKDGLWYLEYALL